MRLTTKFSAFVTLLTGLTIFVTLIGCSLSFYNAVQYKYVSRVQAAATAIDTHLVTHDIVSLTPQIDELMIASDIVRVDLLQGSSGSTAILAPEVIGQPAPATCIASWSYRW